VGGGIYTKAADVGADLVGKVEAGIPEDDPRNPATIADNVGDNVGDVAGMGADLYESYYGSILATLALGAPRRRPSARSRASFGDAARGGPAGPRGHGHPLLDRRRLHRQGPRTTPASRSSSRACTRASMSRSADHRARAGPALLPVRDGRREGIQLAGITTWWGLGLSIISGLIAGNVIAYATEYYTSYEHKPTQRIAEQALTGPATVIISGIAEGMKSTWASLLTVVVAIIAAFSFAGGGDSFLMGLYGVGIAAVGMLSTLGITLATDAYGPIADNAGGNAEMTGQPPQVRERTDMLDSLGNTTAATGKGFAIGSAALTALALFTTFAQTYRRSATEAAVAKGKTFEGFTIDILSPEVTVGLLVGAMLPFLFSALTMKAVGKAAFKMIEEVRRQFRDIPGLMEGTAEPKHGRCVSIATRGALGQMIIPGLLAVVAPIAVGALIGPEALGGLLAGALSAGVVMAIFMANAGGAWDNAKKYIEAGNLGGKGSDTHKAAVVGDTVGDPFKDTSGPSINILIKLMCIVSLIFIPLFVALKYAG
jgi:K(+)-stimulated pyrophosphate-energized sodium pump